MFKRSLQMIGATVLGAALLLADGRGTPAPQTPAQQVASRVARLTVLLTLTTAQQTTATTIFTTEQAALAALDTPRQTAETAMQTAVKANNVTGISTQAAALGNLEQQEELAEGTADAAFYRLLTVAQRAIFDNVRAGGLDNRGGH